MTQVLERTIERPVAERQAQPRTWPARRVTRFVVGLALVVGAIGMLGAGVYAGVVKASGSYVELGAHGDYHTDRYGLATESTDWSTTLLGWAGSVRLEVRSSDERTIFVGVATPDAMRRYLADVSYTTIRDDNGGTVRTDHAGEAPVTSPTSAIRWTASAEGKTTQTLRWDATAGRQVVLVMNADGSRAVHVRVLSSAVTVDRMPWWLPGGALVIGVIALAIGIVLIQRTRARRKAA